MNFNDFISSAWRDHAKKTAEVASNLKKGLELVEKSDELPQLAQIVTHVYGEHLGRWQEGLELLESFEGSKLLEDESASAINRCKAVLEIGANQRSTLDEFSKSEQIRILAMSTSALMENGQTEKAIENFQDSLALAEEDIPNDDPANRSLAITGNNLACALEEKEQRSADETKLMILAAQTGRKYWEIAGTWVETERAEYRLAMTYLIAGRLDDAYDHAKSCLEISEKNNAEPIELFFANEVLALVEKAKGNQDGYAAAVSAAQSCFEKLSDDDQSWCKSTLEKLT